MNTAAQVTVSADLRAALLEMLSPGRAVTVVEIRERLHHCGLGHLPTETLYRNLALLSRRGAVRRIDHAGQPRAYWAISESAALHLGSV